MKKRLTVYVSGAVFFLCIINILSFFGGCFINDNYMEIVAEQINQYVSREKERTFGKIVSEDYSSDSMMNLDPFAGHISRFSGYSELNKLYLVTEKNADFPTVTLKIDNEDVYPTLMFYPTGSTKYTYFNVKLLAGSFPDKFPSSSCYYLSQSLADKIIDSQTLVAETYEDLINQRINTAYNRSGGKPASQLFTILGVIDDNQANAKFYKEAYGADFCITPYHSLYYYFTNISFVFEVGKLYASDRLFLKKAEALVKSEIRYKYALEFYEKDFKGEYVKGEIDYAYDSARQFHVSQMHTAYLFLYMSLLLASCGGYVAWTTIFLGKLHNFIEKNKRIFAYVYSGGIFIVFSLISLILLPLRGFHIGSGLYIPFVGALPSVTAIFVFLNILIVSLMIKMLVAKRKNKEQSEKNITAAK